MRKLSFIALIASIVLVGSLFFVGLLNVRAMSETDLKAKFYDTVVLNGDNYGLSKGDLVQVDRYFNQYNLSSADCDYIAERIDTAKGIIEADGHAVFADYSASTKQQLKVLVDEIVAHTSVKAKLERGAVVILNSDNSVFTEVTRLVKQTGFETSYTAILASISLVVVAIGTCLIIRQVKTSK